MVPTPGPVADALSEWQPGYFYHRLFPGASRFRLTKYLPQRGASMTAVEVPAATVEEEPTSLPPVGTGAAERPIEDWELEGAKLLEADLAAQPPKAPTKVGTVTNWEGYSCEIWYHPDVSSYGVVCPFDPTRDSGAIYRDSVQAKLYAEGTLGIGSR